MSLSKAIYRLLSQMRIQRGGIGVPDPPPPGKSQVIWFCVEISIWTREISWTPPPPGKCWTPLDPSPSVNCKNQLRTKKINKKNRCVQTVFWHGRAWTPPPSPEKNPGSAHVSSGSTQDQDDPPRHDQKSVD